MQTLGGGQSSLVAVVRLDEPIAARPADSAGQCYDDVTTRGDVSDTTNNTLYSVGPDSQLHHSLYSLLVCSHKHPLDITSIMGSLGACMCFSLLQWSSLCAYYLGPPSPITRYNFNLYAPDHKEGVNKRCFYAAE